MRVENLEGPWQLELKLPDDRIGYVMQAQKVLYEELRSRLEEVIREQSGDASAEQLDQVSDKQLVPKLRELLAGQLMEDLSAGIAGVAAEIQDETLRAALEKVAQARSYQQARGDLQKLIDRIPDENRSLRIRLCELLDDGIDDRLLSVTFILATDPNEKLQGKVTEIEWKAEVRGEEGNTVLVKVEIDKDQVPHLRPGQTVTANLYCGRRAIGYVWFHDLLAFIQSRILFRYF